MPHLSGEFHKGQKSQREGYCAHLYERSYDKIPFLKIALNALIAIDIIVTVNMKIVISHAIVHNINALRLGGDTSVYAQAFHHLLFDIYWFYP